MQPAGFHSIRWQLPLTYALIALVSAVSLSVLLIGVLRQYYWQQEYAMLDNTSLMLSHQLGVRMNEVLTEETLANVPALRFVPDYRIELLNPAGKTVFDTGLLETLTVTFAQPVAASVTQLTPENPWFSLEMRQMPPWEGFTQGAITMASEETALPGYDLTMSLTDTSQARIVVAPDDNTLPSRLTSTWSAGASGPDGAVWSVASGGATSYGALDDISTFQRVRSDASVTRAILTPFGAVLGFVRLSNPPAIGSVLIDSVTSGAILAGMGAIMIAAVLGWAVSQRLTRPILALNEATARMTQGDLAARVHTPRRDELGALAVSFNVMAGKVETTVDTLRRFAADAAHELHTPLTALRTNLELTRERPDAARLTEAVAQIARLEVLADDLLDLSRLEVAEMPSHEAVDIGALVREVSEVYASRAEQVGIEFALNIGAALPTVRANAGLLRRALGNLLDNAVKFTPSGGDVLLATSTTDGRLQFVVEDSGIGIPSGDLPVLFSRFHRGSNTADYPGSGLGLAIVKAIADVHQGSVQAENTRKGARFVFQVPLSGS